MSRQLRRQQLSGLSLHAKTGTAEVGKGKRPHSWFVGFSGDYAFAVCLENSGFTARRPGPAANQVLQAMKKRLGIWAEDTVNYTRAYIRI